MLHTLQNFIKMFTIDNLNDKQIQQYEQQIPSIVNVKYHLFVSMVNLQHIHSIQILHQMIKRTLQKKRTYVYSFSNW